MRLKGYLFSRIGAFSLAGVIAIGGMFGSYPITAYARTSSEQPVGQYYEFGEKDHYEYDSSTSSTKTGNNTFGTFTATGDFSKVDGTTYLVKSGNVEFKYTFDNSKLSAEDTEWHLIEDKSKKVNNLKFSKNILNGALILESSIDGENWTTDVMKQNIFTVESDLAAAFYTTKDIQQQNGCFFRVTVVYELERKTGDHKVAFVTVDDKETKKVAEVYKFKVVNKEFAETKESTKNERKELGKKVNAGKDSGYAENNTIDKDDPHFGWDLGTFFVDGYTRATSDSNDTPVFLKNVGDKVTLWFNLKQDINSLNGNSNLTIAEDKNGWDKDFEVPQSNFGHGTLIIRYTDWHNEPQTPVVYTNYLEANAKTGADTRVQLFEEGDYEVSLDYEIKNNPRKVGPVSVVPTYTNYKIKFKFKIRNGNCMVFPFDLKTTAELADKAVTQNGFKLDMAKSRYLTIDVSKSIVNVAADGQLSLDERFNRPASDGEEYTEDGIYTFTVKNLFTNSTPTTKTIYVGSDKNMLALAKSKKSISEINEMIRNGATIESDGTIVEPEPIVEEEVKETETIVEETTEIEETSESVETTPTEVTASADDTVKSETVSEIKPIVQEESETDEIEEVDMNDGGKNFPIVPVVVVGVACAGIGYGLAKRKPSNTNNKDKEGAE